MSKRRKQPKAVHVIYLDAVLDIPPELWEIIASSLPRQSLAALCLVCRQFCCIISALLYRDLSNPPLNITQSACLVETLSNDEALCCPTPSLLIRKLAFQESHSAKEESEAAIEVLRGIASHPQGSILRALHWDSMPGLDDLGRIVLDQTHLPNLKELVVRCNAEHVNNFNFIQSCGLETFELDLQIPASYGDYELGEKICYRLAEALPMLPFSSPRLHTFRFRLAYPYDMDYFGVEPYSDLVATMNDALLFPALTHLQLAVDLGDEEYPEFNPYADDSPSTNFQKLLAANPSLLELILSAPQTKCPLDDNIPVLPRLRSLTGTFEFAAQLLAGPARLEKLDLSFVDPLYFEYPIFRTAPLPSHPSLTHLRVLAVDSDGKPMKLVDELTPDTFAQLASSFRNLTHLDICISSRFDHYRKDLVLLTKLQSLRIQEYRTTSSALTTDPARLKRIFPPSEYTKEFKLIVPHLPELKNIEICILADVVEEEDLGDLMYEPAAMKIEYLFTWIAVRRLAIEFSVRVNVTSG